MGAVQLRPLLKEGAGSADCYSAPSMHSAQLQVQEWVGKGIAGARQARGSVLVVPARARGTGSAAEW